MALVRVQASPKKTQATNASVTMTLPAPPVVGNGLLVLVNYYFSAAHTPSCSDLHGNTYTLAIARKQTNSNAVIFFCPTVTTTGGPFSITVTNSSTAAFWVALAVEIGGVGTGLILDGTISAAGTSAAPATGVTGALTGTEVVQAATHAIAVAQSSISVISATPTWTQEFEELPFTYIAGEANTRVVTSATGTTPSCSWTDSTSGVWAAVLAVFKGTAPASVTTAQPYVWGPL